jgi:nucleoside-diphosphate-sugar epimerase
MKKRILITGATGTVGKEVLKQLFKKRTYEITVLCRDSARTRKCLKPYKNDVHIVHAELAQKEALQALAGPFDIVIHLAAIIPPLANENKMVTFAINHLGTKYLVEHIETTSPDAFFMFSSSVAVYGDRLKSPNIAVNDSLPEQEYDFYAQSKVKAEKAVKGSKLDWTIFRLSGIMGVNNHKMSGVMFFMPLETRMEIATPEDAARAFVNGIECKEKLTSRVFNLGGGETCRTTYGEFLENNFELRGLGKLNFPPKTFAEKNYHCGDFVDGDELEEIARFRSHTLEDYYAMNERAVPFLLKIITSILKRPIKYFIRRQSLPLLAFKTKDQKLMDRFFEYE